MDALRITAGQNACSTHPLKTAPGLGFRPSNFVILKNNFQVESVVFANKCPDGELIPMHANTEVQQMIRRGEIARDESSGQLPLI